MQTIFAARQLFGARERQSMSDLVASLTVIVAISKETKLKLQIPQVMLTVLGALLTISPV